jgi:aminomethyltransferase
LSEPQSAPAAAPLLRTPLYDVHVALGARMVPFAGYSMPVQYPAGVLAEHLHTRAQAGLFDVSHMGQLLLSGPQAAQAFEQLVPVDVIGLASGRQRYGMLLNDQGGILDDLMFSRREDGILVVVNGACKQADIAHIQAHIGAQCTVTPLPDYALLALQGPAAAAALERLVPGVQAMVFMDGASFSWQGHALYITRSGYTGEDGFEISLHQDGARALAEALLAQPEVLPIGLGARNSLRLEAGLCLYGNDMDAATTPLEAQLMWAIQKVRREGGARAGGFIGAEALLAQMQQGPGRVRVGLKALERIPVREPTVLQDAQGQSAGAVCSGLLGPSADAPIAMAYVPPSCATIGTPLFALVRGKRVPMEVCAMPFVPHQYRRTR